MRRVNLQYCELLYEGGEAGGCGSLYLSPFRSDHQADFKELFLHHKKVVSFLPGILSARNAAGKALRSIRRKRASEKETRAAELCRKTDLSHLGLTWIIKMTFLKALYPL